MDDTSGQLNRVVAMKHASFQRGGNRNMAFPAIVEYPFFTRSELSNGVQLADLLAYNVYRAFKLEDFGYPYFERVLPNFYRRRNGEALDGLKVWPVPSPLAGAAREAWSAYKQKASWRRANDVRLGEPYRAHQGHPTRRLSGFEEAVSIGNAPNDVEWRDEERSARSGRRDDPLEHFAAGENAPGALVVEGRLPAGSHGDAPPFGRKRQCRAVRRGGAVSLLRIDEAASIQFPMVTHAAEIGWTPVPPKDATAMRGGEAGMLFRDDLGSALAALNPWMSAETVRQVIERLEALPPTIEGYARASRTGSTVLRRAIAKTFFWGL